MYMINFKETGLFDKVPLATLPQKIILMLNFSSHQMSWEHKLLEKTMGNKGVSLLWITPFFVPAFPLLPHRYPSLSVQSNQLYSPQTLVIYLLRKNVDTYRWLATLSPLTSPSLKPQYTLMVLCCCLAYGQMLFPN